jgi:hypothetical protein
MNISQLTPEQLQAILASGGVDQDQGLLDRQRAIAQMLRQQAGMDRSGGQMAGRVYIPNANLGTALGQMAQGYMARKMGEQADTTQRGISGRQTAAKQQYLDALTAVMRRNQPQPQQEMPPPGQMPQMGQPGY